MTAPAGEAEALRRLSLVLARPEFQPQPLLPWERAFNTVRDWLVDLVRSLLEGVPDAAVGRLGWVQTVAVVVALAALAALLVFVLRAIGLSVSRDASRREAAAAQVRARSDALWREGQALGRAGQYGAACRALYLSALYALEEHDLVRVDEGQTNEEHATRAVGVRPELAGTFQRLVRRYDRVRYGHLDVDRPAFEEIGDLVAQTRAERPAPAAA